MPSGKMIQISPNFGEKLDRPLVIVVTAGTIAFKKNIDPGDVKAGHFRDEFGQAASGNIEDLPASKTGRVMVLFKATVKTLDVFIDIQLKNIFILGQIVQIAVNRAQADARQTFAHDMIKLIRCGVSSQFAQFVQDNAPLYSHAALRCFHLFHEAPFAILTHRHDRAPNARKP